MTDSRYPLAQRILIELKDAFEMDQVDPADFQHKLGLMPRIFEIIDDNILDFDPADKQAIMVAAVFLQAPPSLIARAAENTDYFRDIYGEKVETIITQLLMGMHIGKGDTPELDLADGASKVASAEVIIEQILNGYIADRTIIQSLKDSLDDTAITPDVLAAAGEYKFAIVMRDTMKLLEDTLDQALDVLGPGPVQRRPGPKNRAAKG